jgi:hypothetical protein
MTDPVYPGHGRPCNDYCQCCVIRSCSSRVTWPASSKELTPIPTREDDGLALRA